MPASDSCASLAEIALVVAVILVIVLAPLAWAQYAGREHYGPPPGTDAAAPARDGVAAWLRKDSSRSASGALRGMETRPRSHYSF